MTSTPSNDHVSVAAAVEAVSAEAAEEEKVDRQREAGDAARRQREATAAAKAKSEATAAAKKRDEEEAAVVAAAAAKVPAPRVANPKKSGKQQQRMKKQDAKHIQIVEGMTIKSMSEEMGVRLVDVIKTIIKLGEEPKTSMDSVKLETAELVLTEYGMEPVLPEGSESVTKYRRSFDDQEYASLPLRAPIVTVMGHVDHGKTSLLDYLRATSVASGEAGGITQSIAAFEVERPGLGRICFIDTPGHKAFGAMRQRGAKVTDIVILVVAAIDGVMPQTIEVIQHAREAQVPLVIAVNKCDLPDANPERVLEELMMHGVVVEELGGDVQSVNISALTGMNVDKLEEAVALMAEMMELRAPPEGPAEGVVIESRKDKGLGDVASVIVQMGLLKVGDFMVAGTQWGRVRALRDFNGKTLEQAGPSTVVDVVGFRGHPGAGNELHIVPTEKAAVSISAKISERKTKTETRQTQATLRAAAPKAMPLKPADTAAEEASVEIEQLPILVKANVDGALEAIVASLMDLPRLEIALKIVSAAVGPVTDHDVHIAATAGAEIYTFNTKSPGAGVQKVIKSLKVEVREHRIIYDLIDDVTRSLVERLPAEEDIEEISTASVLQVFEMKGKGTIAGCTIESGSFVSTGLVQVERNGEIVHEGKVASLRRNKDTVKEIGSGSECGILLESFSAFEPGDVLRCIKREMRVRTTL